MKHIPSLVGCACLFLGLAYLLMPSLQFAVRAQAGDPHNGNDVVVDIGDIIGPVSTINLSAANTTSSTWVIKSVDSSCGCLQAEPQSNRVEPGQRLYVRAQISTQGRIGPQEYRITALLGDGQVSWRVVGRVPFPVRVDDKRLVAHVPHGVDEFVVETWAFHGHGVGVTASLPPEAEDLGWASKVGSSFEVTEDYAKTHIVVKGRMQGSDYVSQWIRIAFGGEQGLFDLAVEARRAPPCTVSPAVVLADCSQDGFVNLASSCQAGLSIAHIDCVGDGGHMFTGECVAEGQVVVRWKAHDRILVPIPFELVLVMNDGQIVEVPGAAF